MPPILALLLCTGFVLALLCIERKQAPGVSWRSWIPTLWMMSCACKPLAAWTGVGGESVEGGSPLDRALASGLIVAGLLVVTSRNFVWQDLKRNRWLIAIYLYALLSIVWSDFPFVSLKRYVRFTGSLVIGLVVLSETEPWQALDSILRRTAFVLIPFSLVLIKYFPNFGVAYGRWSGGQMWVGVADQKNSFGILCFVSSFYLFWRLLRAWQEEKGNAVRQMIGPDFLIFVMALYLLKGPTNAYSATSVFVFMLGGGILLGLLWLQSRGKHLGMAALVVFAVVLFAYGLGTPFGLRSIGSGFLQLIGRDATFTDRDEIWAELIPAALSRPVLGHGYGGFWVLAGQFDVNEAHNGYLNVMLELGAVGILLVLAFVVSMCRTAHAALSRDFWRGALGLCFLFMTVLHNTATSSLLRTSDLLWSLLICISLLVQRLLWLETGAQSAETMTSDSEVEDAVLAANSAGEAPADLRSPS